MVNISQGEVPQRTILFLIADTGAGHRSAANAIWNAITLIAQTESTASVGADLSQPTASAELAERVSIPSASRSPIDRALDSPIHLPPSIISTWASAERVSIPSPPMKPSAATATLPNPPPAYRIEIVDVFEEYSRFPLREAVKLYGPTIRFNPKLYGRFFHLSNQPETVSAIRTVATPFIQNGLMRLITSVRPDVIVSVHPMLNHVTIQALQELGLPIPFITVVTDLISVHYAWFAPGADAYIVPTEQAKRLALQRGLDPERMHVLGMPIDPKFRRLVASKPELQRKFGLEPGKPVVLLVGGGDGAGGLEAATRAISRARLPVQLMIVTGRNRRLYARLQRTRSTLHVPAQVFGFVQNMPELMHAADVIITKAGPGTICEALACGLPIILSGYVPGQESGNVDFVVTSGVGTLAHNSVELVDMLRRLVKPGSPEMRRQLENAKRVSRPWASFDIAKCILSFLPPADQPSIWKTAQWHERHRKLSGRLRSAIRIRAPRRNLPRPTISKNPVSTRLKRLTKMYRKQDSPLER